MQECGKNKIARLMFPEIKLEVFSKDRTKSEQTADGKYMEKAHRPGKIGWNAGR